MIVSKGMEAVASAASYVSDNFSIGEMTDGGKQVWDFLTGRSYNESTTEWKELPECVAKEVVVEEDADEGGNKPMEPKDGKGIFVQLRVNSDFSSFLSAERVYYQAQFHLCLYYSLVKKASQIEFPTLYDRARSTSFWEHVDNLESSPYPDMKIGDYALLELCIDCVMLVYLMPHVPKTRSLSTETDVTQCHVAQAFELVYFRLLRHLCALVEAYIDLVDVEAGAMMTLKTATHFLCRSVNRQAEASGAGQVPTDSPPKPTPSTQEPKGEIVISTTKPLRVKVLQKPLDLVEGDRKQISKLPDIKSLQHRRITAWNEHLKRFRDAQYDDRVGLKKELAKLVYLIDPTRFPPEQVYCHVHKRASHAIVVATSLVEKVCTRLYLSQEDLDEGADGELGTATFERWRWIIHNQKLYFRHFSGGV